MNKNKDFLKLTCNYRDSHYKLTKIYNGDDVVVKLNLYKSTNNNNTMIYESKIESAMIIYLNLLGLNFEDFKYHYTYHHSIVDGYTEYYETEPYEN